MLFFKTTLLNLAQPPSHKAISFTYCHIIIVTNKKHPCLEREFPTNGDLDVKMLYIFLFGLSVNEERRVQSNLLNLLFVF